MVTKVEFTRVQTDAEVENIDVKDGQLIYTGTGKTYMDYGNQRIATGSGGGSGTVDTEMSDSSTNAVQNKVIKEYIDNQISIGNTEPTDDENKLWIDTGAVASSVSEITNEYSTSETIGYSANYVNNLNTYSTTEHRVGTYNNKPVYRTVIIEDPLVYSTANVDYTFSYIYNMSEILKIDGIIWNSSRVLCNNLPYTNNTGKVTRIFINNSTGAVAFNSQDTFSNAKLIAVIEYTKTTD